MTIPYHNPDYSLPWAERPFHWSQMSSWEYDPEQWYQNYYLGIRSKPNRELLFGSMVDDKIQNDPSFIPSLERYPIQQHSMSVMFKGISLNGTGDHFDRKGRRLKDDKTGKVAWTQKRADETGQFSFYLMLLYISEGIRPEEMTCYIDWLPTVLAGDFTIQFRDTPVVPITFKTVRTMKDILAFGVRIQETRKAMLEFALNYQ